MVAVKGSTAILQCSCLSRLAIIVFRLSVVTGVHVLVD